MQRGANFTTPPLIYSDFHIFNTFRSMAWRGREALLPERKGEARSRVVLQQMALLPRPRQPPLRSLVHGEARRSYFRCNVMSMPSDVVAKSFIHTLKIW